MMNNSTVSCKVNDKNDNDDSTDDRIFYVNGKYCKVNDAKISVLDRGFLFGDGIYEVIPVVRGQLIHTDYFLQRWHASLDGLFIRPPMCNDEFINMHYNLIRHNNLTEGVIYSQVTRGFAAERDFIFPTDGSIDDDNAGNNNNNNTIHTPSPTIVAFTKSMPILENTHAKTGIKVVSTPDLRWQNRHIKSTQLLAQVLAKQYAHEHGAYEAWMVEGTNVNNYSHNDNNNNIQTGVDKDNNTNHDDDSSNNSVNLDAYVTEGGSSTAYIVKNGVVITRPLKMEAKAFNDDNTFPSSPILPGIRRRVVWELCQKNKIPFVERAFTLQEAITADEAFISSATTMILPVVQIDDYAINGNAENSSDHDNDANNNDDNSDSETNELTGQPGPITTKLRELYIAEILEQVEKSSYHYNITD